MPRVRWCGATHSVLCLFVAIAGVLWSFWIVAVNADCWYDEERHDEGTEVYTAEPCLNCTCSKGALLCYLRVCPKFPNPPPVGCFLLHRYKTCCSELICPEFIGLSNRIEARSEPDDDFDISFEETISKNACISNGTIFGPGSAMDTSSSCEYCYCLGGKQTCIKPKCLPPVEGCAPIYNSAYCCPIHYNCTAAASSMKARTTTERPQDERGGCTVDGIYYPDGSKVLDIGHSVCDNCYCLKGLVRCEPQSCAPPLLGCSPVVKSGECCAASYNCSGTIEIQPEPFYGNFPVISKEYAKLRKELNDQSSKKIDIVTVSPLPDTAHFRQRSPATFGTTRHFTGVSSDSSTTGPFLHHAITKKDSKLETNTTGQDIIRTSVLSTTMKQNYPETTTSEEGSSKSDYLDFFEENIFSLFEAQAGGKDGDNSDGKTTLYTETTTEPSGESTTTELPTTTKFFEENTTEFDTSTTFDQTTEINPITNILTNELSSNIPHPITVKSVVKSTDCIESEGNTLNLINNNQTSDSDVVLEDLTSRRKNTSEATTDHSNEVESRKKLSTATLRSISDSPENGVIFNKTGAKITDYDYDYGEPTLPPSLPNLRIIPFVAEDALDVKEQLSKEELGYPIERVVDNDSSFEYHNHFSPPTKTEGGFIPKDPPVLDDLYGNTVTASSPSDENKQNADCLTHDGTKVLHGQSVVSDSPCITCTCFYGNIACQKPNCPIPRPGCRISSVQDLTLCCPRYICGDGASTSILDRPTGTMPQNVVNIADRVSTPYPFRDVIRTEPAPNLQSLITDVTPFSIQENYTSKPDNHKTATAVPMNSTETQTPDEQLTLDKVLQLLLFSKENDKSEFFGSVTTDESQIMAVKRTDNRTTATTSIEENPNLPQLSSDHDSSTNLNNNIDSNTGSALLINLAGCNIYGRMYRVGRIISELSGPCLQCKCTEIGVHCEDLKC